MAPRPAGYEPLAVQNLDPAWIARLGSRDGLLGGDPGVDAPALGESMNECMRCWETLLPHVVRPPSSPVDLAGLLRHYQERSHGAMYSGCGGGYLFVVSDAAGARVFQRPGAHREAGVTLAPFRVRRLR